MTGREGSFGISETQYGNNMTCGWKILVEIGKVSTNAFGKHIILYVFTHFTVAVASE